ncbi:uncharacterized protein I206_107732 [Kwoniella pini CBS 10737]|uniref:Uncharacterized protein n=1 Tax=Kwoniella pini CBS 10737 TaxID=1296096 RepID=A0A1B9HY86_9TREE|nr:uncharacterized protein I206_06066 [Kwoniella pini CBS 10737]OCF48198.1 hypothetical protein I206_06066 [Kwoniella pini CBS 10737]
MSSDSVSPQDDCVRPLEEKDEKIVKMLIGQGVMEGLAKANNKFITNPLIILIILILGLYLNNYMSFKVDSSNILTYITIIIGPCLILLPILGLIEFIHRPKFSSNLRKIIGSLDLIKLFEYYNNNNNNNNNQEKEKENSGWVFIHKNEIIGIILIDGLQAGKELNSVLGEEEGEISNNKNLFKQIENDQLQNSNLRKRNNNNNNNSLKSKSENVKEKENLIEIRHFDIDSPYRKIETGVSNDLLIKVLENYFNKSSKVDKIIIQVKPFSNWQELILSEFGFKKLKLDQLERLKLNQPKRIGLLGWKGFWMMIEKKDWLERRDQIFASS